jgi:toxin YoeB
MNIVNIIWTPLAWEDYEYWQKTEPDKVEKINALIKDCKRNPFSGLGKPEPLKGNLKGFWSRRISLEDRFVYTVSPAGLTIVQCRFHY